MKAKILAMISVLAAAVVGAGAGARDATITPSVTQEALSANFDALVDPDDNTEYTLELSSVKVQGEPHELVGKLLGLEASDAVNGGAIESFKLFELWGDAAQPEARIDAVVAALFKHDPSYVPFFCHRFKGLEDHYDDHTPCKAKVRELLAPIAADPRAQVVVADVEADYYGSNRWVTLYVGRYESAPGDTTNVGEYVMITFDILHEI